jgi:hypothetical protein
MLRDSNPPRSQTCAFRKPISDRPESFVMDTASIFYSGTHIARRTAAGTVTRHGGFPMPTSACTRHRKSHNSIAAGNKLSGWEVDKAARDVLQVAGYAEYLNNRVGHSIGTEVHGTVAISTTSSLATSARYSLNIFRSSLGLSSGVWLAQRSQHA